MRADLDQFEFVDPLLRSIVLDIEHRFGFEFTMTSIFRIDDEGVHGTLPVRGVDVRCPVEEVGIIIVKYVNSKYQYDPDRIHLNCCLWHDTGNGPHCHLQVHANTVILNQ